MTLPKGNDQTLLTLKALINISIMVLISITGYLVNDKLSTLSDEVRFLRDQTQQFQVRQATVETKVDNVIKTLDDWEAVTRPPAVGVTNPQPFGK